MKNLVYVCIFYKKILLDMFHVFLKSYSLYNKSDDNIDLVVLTQQDFNQSILDIAKQYNVDIKLINLNVTTVVEAKSSRLTIFQDPMIKNYNNILYLDIDIIIAGNLQDLLNKNLDDKLYVVKAGEISSTYHGRILFDLYETDFDYRTPGFNSGVLLFKNCKTIQNLFQTILNHIIEYNKKTPITGMVDQPFFNYHAIKKNLHDTNLLQKYSMNCCFNYKPNGKHIIYHFPGTYSNINQKINVMENFLKQLS